MVWNTNMTAVASCEMVFYDINPTSIPGSLSFPPMDSHVVEMSVIDLNECMLTKPN